MFCSSSRSNSGASSFLINSGSLSLGVPGLPGCKSLFFASPKKSNQKKGDPQSGPLCGSLKKLKVPENLETSRLCRRRTSKFFIRPFQLFQAQPGRVGGLNSGSNFLPLPMGEGWGEGCTRIHFSQPVLAGLEIAPAAGLKNLDVRRLRSRLVSKFSGYCRNFKEPQSGPDCGSPFFWLLFFGEAKKSKSPAGASPGTPN